MSLGHGGAGRHLDTNAGESKSVETLRKLGIESLTELNADIASQLEIPVTPGVLVRQVRPGSEAAAKHIVPNTVITRIMGVPVKTPDELLAALDKHDLSKGVRVTVMHGNEPDIVVLEVPK